MTTPRILTGAAEIAAHVFGDASKTRSVYNLQSAGMPSFKLGGTLCARPEALDAWLATAEGSGGAARAQEQTDYEMSQVILRGPDPFVRNETCAHDEVIMALGSMSPDDAKARGCPIHERRGMLSASRQGLAQWLCNGRQASRMM